MEDKTGISLDSRRPVAHNRAGIEGSDPQLDVLADCKKGHSYGRATYLQTIWFLT
jgi:hypothetical protein